MKNLNEKRKNDDLLIQQKIPLVEALCGTTFLLTHLDGRKIVVKTQPGEIVRPGDVKTIDDEGMPMHKNPFVKVISSARAAKLLARMETGLASQAAR